MKKILCYFIAVLVFAFSLSSCTAISDIQLPALPVENSNVDSETESSESNIVAEVDEDVETETDLAENNATVIVSGNAFESSFEAPDGSGETILTFSYTTPVVNIVGSSEASNAINDYLNSVDELYYSGNESYSGVNYYHELALDNYSYVKGTGSDINTDFYSVRKFTCSRCDGSVVSFIYTTYDYFGISNENYTSFGLNFNVADGSKIEFNDITSDYEALLDACAEYLSDTDFVNNDLLSSLAANDGWYLDNNGLNFITPDCSVLHNVENNCVPYEVISELVYPSYLVNTIDADLDVSVSLESSEDYSDNTVNIIDRVQVDDTSDCAFLIINGTAYDVSVSFVEYNDYSADFLITDTLWYCNVLSDSAVQLEIGIPSGLPEIMICYKDANGNNYRYLVAAGEGNDGLILTDETIVPLG